MKKLYPLIFLLHLCAITIAQQQQLLLFAETFDDPVNLFVLDSAGPGTNLGNNKWVINNQYTGQPSYSNTPPQDSIFSGTISGAPYSKYLHIYNSASGISNANWSPNSASDRFCYTGNSYCTLGLTNAILTFFWLCEGDANSYGEVYYRSGNGPWKKTGKDKYNGQRLWKYEEVQDTGFNNKADLQFGFRWKNTGGGNSNSSFSVDDVIGVGTYVPGDSIASRLTVQVFSDTICGGDPISMYFGLSKPVCDGTYRFELSNASGNFSNPTNLGIVTRGMDFTGGTFNTLTTPTNLQGNCFRMRVVRTGPAPVIISDTSACFTIKNCPNIISNLAAAVLNDEDTACVLSVIDVQFNSTGAYGNSNKYMLEMSDTNGSFDTPILLGSLSSKDAFPNLPKGNIAGIIPATVPAGCGYYIRIRSTSPAAANYPIGPYCLKQCNIVTNGTNDMRYCIQSATYPSCDTILIQPDYWSKQVVYDNCNDWKVELRSMKNFNPVSLDFIRSFHTTNGGEFLFCMPSRKEMLPVPPGEYYMRIVSNCSNQYWNQHGTVVRMAIGAPDSVPPKLTADGFGEETEVELCLGSGGGSAILSLRVSPFNTPPSLYEWSSDFLNNGRAFFWRDNPLNINIPSNAGTGRYSIYVREVNFGCVGRFSHPFDVSILGRPEVAISGAKTVCVGDTVKYNVTFQEKTYYDWRAPDGVEVFYSSNSEASMIFNETGTYTISNYSVNACDSANGTYRVKVIPPYLKVNEATDQTICKNDSIRLQGLTMPRGKVFAVSDSGTIGDKRGGMFNIIARENLTVDSFAIKAIAPAGRLFGAEVWVKNGSYLTFEQNEPAWQLQTTQIGLRTTSSLSKVIISAPVERYIAKGDTAAFYVTASTDNVHFAYKTVAGAQGVVYASDSFMRFVQGTANLYPFGSYNQNTAAVLDISIYYSTAEGLNYVWNTGDTLPRIALAPMDSGNYSYVVKISDQGLCGVYDTIAVRVNNCINGVDENEDNGLSLAYPNPTRGKLFLQTPDVAITVKIYNLHGEMVRQFTRPGNLLDLSELADGEYFLSLMTADRTFKQKIILVK